MKLLIHFTDGDTKLIEHDDIPNTYILAPAGRYGWKATEISTKFVINSRHVKYIEQINETT